VTISRHLDQAPIANLLTQKEVCELLRISAATLKRLRQSRRIQYISFGAHSIRFRLEDVQTFVRRRQRAVEYAEKEA
jgi:excisionase family DNA binding protein